MQQFFTQCLDLFPMFVKELMLESHENVTLGAAILGLSSDSLYLLYLHEQGWNV